MILVDERVGSRELLEGIRNLGCDAQIAGKLDADFMWSGNGESGPLLVGVERKALGDLLTSMRDRRLAGGQIGRMRACCDINYLLVEGIWRRQRETGLVEIPVGRTWQAVRGGFKMSEVTRFMTSLQEIGDIRLWRTSDEEQSCAWLVDQFEWWQKPWSSHKTGQSIYSPGPTRPNNSHRVRAFRSAPTLLQCWLSSLPGLDSRAYEFSDYFSSPLDLANSDEHRWVTIKGVGKKTAQSIVKAIKGETE